MIDLLDQMGQTPLEARQNSLLYSFIFIAIIVVVALMGVYLVLRYLGKLHSSKKWIDAQKAKPTTKKNVASFAKTAALEDSEQNLLWLICHENDIKNIEFNYMDTAMINSVFHSTYQKFKASNLQDKISTLFSLRYKIEKLVAQRSSISTARALQEGQELLFVDDHGSKWMLELTKKDDKGFYLKMPPQITQYNLRPEQLSKIKLDATLKNDMHYALYTRVIRYENGKEGNDYMVVSSSMTLKGEVRRRTKRMAWEGSCHFSAVATTIKNGSTKFEVAEKKYKGILQDISAHGCCLACGLPIKKEQFISIECDFDEYTHLEAIGTIVATKHSSDKKYYILHIKFEKITKATQNAIYAFIYGYNKEAAEENKEEEVPEIKDIQ